VNPVLDRLAKGSQTETETAELRCQTESGSDPGPSGPALSIFKLEHNPEMVKFYTGLETYGHFLYVFHCLGPAAEELQYRVGISSATLGCWAISHVILVVATSTWSHLIPLSILHMLVNSTSNLSE
jgi:hypothetical protein